MSISNSLQIGASGLAAASRQTLAASHNLANLLTPNFQPLSATQQELSGGGVRAELGQTVAPDLSDPAIENTVSLLGSVYQVKFNAVVIRTADHLLGSLLDLKA
jgi:hypothetical protein